MELQKALEGYIFNDTDIGFRLDKWNLKDKRILLVTGHSGSGKTTLAFELAKKHDAYLIEFDWFDFYVRYPFKPGNPCYYEWKLYTDCITEANGGKPIDVINLGHVNRLKLFVRSWDIFKEKVKKEKKLFICEGLQVVSLLNVTKAPYTYPCIIKGTSAVTSAIRKMRRDHVPGHRGFDMGDEHYSSLDIIVLWMGDEPMYKTFMSRQLAAGRPQDVNMLLN